MRLFEADNADQLLGINIYESGNPGQLWNGAAAAVEELRNGRKIQLQKWWLTTLKGNRRLLDIVAVPATSDEHKTAYVLGFAREISSQKRAESEQALLASIVQSADAAIISLSLDFRILSWNAAAETLFGYAAEETIGRRAVEIITRQGCEANAHADFFNDVRAFRAREREANYFERTLRRKDATPIQVSLISSGIYDRNAQLTGVSIIVRDISEQKRAEKEQALLAAAVRSSDDAIISLSPTPPNFPVMTWNKGAERLFGFVEYEAIGRSIADLYVVPELRERAMNSVRDHVETFEQHPESVSRLEVPARRSDGSLLEVSIAVSGIFDGSGKLLGLSSIIRDITKRKRAEREQALLASIVAYSDDAIIGLAPDGRVMSWNQGAQRLFGFEPDEALGKTVDELYVPPKGRKRAEEEIRSDFAAIKENSCFVRRLETVLQKKDGSLVDVSVATSGIIDPNGGILGMSVIIRDITEIRRTEHKQRMLAAIVDATDDAIIAVSKNLAIASWNPAAGRLYGFSAEEAIGHGLDLFTAAEDQDYVAKLSRRILTTGEPISYEHHARKSNGEQVVLQVNLFPIRDGAGNIIASAGIGRDITEMLRLQREQAELATIVNASDDAIIGVSKDLKITIWNAAASAVYGFSAKEAIGQGFDLFIPPEDLGRVTDVAGHVFQTGEPVNLDLHVKNKNGESLVLLVNIFAIRGSGGEIVATAGIAHDITRLKRIETELREAHEYTRGLIESSIDAMVMIDGEMRIMDGNQQLARLLEIPKKTLLGTPFERYFKDPSAARRTIRKTFSDGYVSNVELIVKAASSREIPVSFNASLFYKAGKVFGIFGVARDVTEQRAAESRLREEREYSRSLVQSSPDALLVSDSNLVLTDVNERALQLTGYTRAELGGSKLPSLFTDAVRAREVVEKAHDNGIVHDIEMFLLTKTAGEIPVSLNASSFRNSDGSGRRIVAAVRDISESRHARQANSLLASIVGSSGDAIYSETTDMVLTSWNPAAEALFGYTATEVVGRSSALLVPLDRRNELGERIQRLLETGSAEYYETVRLRKDGSAIEVAVTQSPILDASGAVMALSVAVRDISERRRMEAELTKARDAALEGARLKSEFLANMSHEIRTPLNSIIGMTGLLLETSLNSEQLEFAHDVRDSGEVLLGLVNNILDFSKIAAGKLVLEEVDFELAGELDSAVEMVAEQARRKRIELTISIEPDVPRLLHGDSGRLRQVLLNLLANAVKFTERGEVAVSVSKLSENPRETMLRFEVRDTGIGIPEDKVHLLFQPFSQVDASTSRKYGGTGLGLSIARELVERMHGTISVSSKPEIGSTFWFTAKLAKQIDGSKPASERFASLTGARILIVDDNANSRRILDRQLTSWGMRPSAAASGEEALAMIRGAAETQFFQAALVDVMMPGMDGIELARKIKSDPALARTAIIFVSSGGPSKEYETSLRGLDVGGWLMKPVPESSLYDALVRVLEPQAENAAAAKSVAEPQAQIGKLDLPSGRKLRVLLAEDNPINQKLATLQLRKLGLEVDAVANGREALGAVSHLPYDIIFMDCQMPEMDGYEATREIRRREHGNGHAVIIAMTAHALPGDREKCLEAGMDSYISKPVKPEAIKRALGEALSANRPPTPVTDSSSPNLPPDGTVPASTGNSGDA